MAQLNGNDLVLSIDSTNGSENAFAYAQSCGLSFSNSLIDTSNKDSGSWEEMIPGRRSFTLSSDGLIDFEAVADRQNFPQFSGFAQSGTPVFFTFTEGFNGYSGQGYIESFEANGASDDVATYSASIKGTTNLLTLETFEGDGTLDTFTLSHAALAAPAAEVRVDGTLQTADFTLSGATLEFTTAPADLAVITVEYAI